jgi:hypothetical protein
MLFIEFRIRKGALRVKAIQLIFFFPLRDSVLPMGLRGILREFSVPHRLHAANTANVMVDTPSPKVYEDLGGTSADPPFSSGGRVAETAGARKKFPVHHCRKS